MSSAHCQISRSEIILIAYKEPPAVGQGWSQRMPLKALQQVEDDIAETRQLIDVQLRLIQKLRDSGHDKGALTAEAFLQILEENLESLRQQRKVIMRQMRQPRATSHPQPNENGAPVKRPRRSAG
jgi:hypothetical protein